MSRTHLISTTAKPTQCPRCRRSTLTAIDEGIPAHIDPTPLDHHAEIAALLANRTTYEYYAGYLMQRDEHNISRPPRGPIHAEHHCPERKK